MKKLKSILILAALLALGGAAHAQTALTQTTLAQKVNGPVFYSGNGSTTTDNCMSLASVSGIAAPSLPGSPVSVIYVGREAFGVLTVNTSTKVVCGLRGYLGTQASPHPSGDMVLVAPQYNTANGGNPVPSGLFSQDPPLNGACTPSGTPTTPWVNVLTGAQWLCSTITNTWVPGFVNPLTDTFSAPNTAVASATSITPSGPLFHVTGTTAVTTITTPVGCDATAVGACSFTLIADAAGSLGTGGNLEIAAAITTVVGKAYTLIWDATNSKWAVQGN